MCAPSLQSLITLPSHRHDLTRRSTGAILEENTATDPQLLRLSCTREALPVATSKSNTTARLSRQWLVQAKTCRVFAMPVFFSHRNRVIHRVYTQTQFSQGSVRWFHEASDAVIWREAKLQLRPFAKRDRAASPLFVKDNLSLGLL